MKKRQTAKYKKRKKKEVVNRKAKNLADVQMTQKIEDRKLMSPARRAFQDV